MDEAAMTSGSEFEYARERAARMKLETLLATIDGIVWEADAQTFMFTFVSERAESILGYPRARWLEKGFWADHIVEADRAAAVSFCLEATGGCRDHEFEYRMLAADGREVWLHDVVTVIAENGQPKTLRGVMLDVTMRKIAEAAGREARQAEAELERRHEQLLTGAAILVVYLDLDGVITFCSDRFIEATGWSKAELIGRSYFDLFAPDERRDELRASVLGAALRPEDRPDLREDELPTRSGQIRTVLWRRSALIDGQGDPIGICCYGDDVTEARRLGLQLRVSEELLSASFEQASVGMCHLDENAAFTNVNERFCQFVRYEKQQLIGATCERCSHPDDHSVVRKGIGELLAGRSHSFSTRARFVRSDGVIAWGELTATALRVDPSSRDRVFVVIEDITLAKEAESLREEAHATYRALFETNNAIKILIDASDGRILDANPAACAFYGYSRDVLTGMPLTRIDCAPEDAVLDMLHAAAESGHGLHYEFIHRLASGETREVEAFTGSIAREGTPLLFAIVHDVTERNVSRRRIVRLQERTETQNHILERMLEGEPLDAVLERVCRFVRSGVPDSLVAIATVDEGDGTLRIRSAPDFPPAFVERAGGAKAGEGIWAGATLWRGEPLAAACDLQSDPAWSELRDLARECGVTSCNSILVRSSQGGALGAIAILRRPTADRDDDEEQTVAVAASLLRVAVERGRDVDTLRAVDARLRAVIAASPLPIQVLALDGSVMLWNRACESGFGWKADDILGKPSPILASGKLAEIRAELGEGHEEVALELSTARRDLTRVELNAFVAPLRGADGGVEGMVVISRDVTEERASALKLRMLAAAFEHAPDGIVITDPESKIIYHNPAMAKATGYSSDELIGGTPRLIKSGKHEAAFYEEMWRTILSGQIWRGRVINKRRDGTFYHEDKTIAPVRDEAGRTISYVAIGRDVTESVALETQLRESQKMEAVGRLAGGIAHDLNNILQGIFSYLDLVRLTLGERVADVEGDLEEVMHAAERAASLTRQLLAFSRKQVVEIRPTNIGALMDEWMRLVRRLMREDIELVYGSLKDPVRVMADAAQIEQVMLNLCINARDSMPSGGTIRVSVERVLVAEGPEAMRMNARPGDYVRLRVRDTGTGMDDVTKQRAFEPFYTTKGASGGSGLGLAVVYGIVKQHDGVIDLESLPGDGTTVDVYLPTCRADAAFEDTATRRSAGRRGASETILFGEDDDRIRTATERFLSRVGYKVICAANGEETVAKFKEHQLDVAMVIVDVVMPKMGGVEAARLIREIDPRAKILFCSGYNPETIEFKSNSEGISDVMAKPFEMERMIEKIREILDRR